MERRIQNKVSFTTLTPPKKSGIWMAPKSTYAGSPFAIEQNAVSNQLTTKFQNLSSQSKVLKSAKANFGPNGKAVKMLRYKNAAGRWVVLTPTGETGEVEFKNLPFTPGVNTLVSYFAIKEASGVSNGAALSFRFTSIDDGEGGTLPSEGSFEGPLNVGSVNSVTPPTFISAEGVTMITLGGHIISTPGAASSQTSLFGLAFQLKGPDGARFHSLRLKNPFAAFQGLEFDPNSWVFDDNRVGADHYEHVTPPVWESNKFVTLTFPVLDYSKIVSDGTKYNGYNIRVSIKNNSSTRFDSDNFTPGEHSFTLDSKYDILIYNSDGQIVDLSNINIYKNNAIYLTD